MTQPLPTSIGAPAAHALADAGINSVDDLVQWTERDLLALHGVGPKAVRLLRDVMTDRGLEFRHTR